MKNLLIGEKKKCVHLYYKIDKFLKIAKSRNVILLKLKIYFCHNRIATKISISGVIFEKLFSTEIFPKFLGNSSLLFTTKSSLISFFV